jgi:DNA-binding CsgD family transcriptional regulator
MTMADGRDLSDVIDGLYDAALDPDRWPEALHAVAEFAGGCALGWVTKDLRVSEGQVHHQFGAEQRYIDLYREHYWRHDPLTPLLCFPAGHMLTTADALPVDVFRDGPFYQEWARPQGFSEAVNLILHKAGTSSAMLSLILEKGDQGTIDEAKRRLSRIAGHVSRAVHVSSAVDSKDSEADVLADTLDLLADAILLVREDGLVVHANAAGRSMLDKGAPFFSMQGRLSTRDSKASAALASTLVAAGRRETSGSASATLALSAKGTRYLAHVVPLTTGLRQHAAGGSRAAAAVFVREATMARPSAPEIIASVHSLTPTELRVLLAIVDSGGIRETAEALGLADTTVKSHLAHIYAKTGSARQADLVKLVAGFADPVST